MPLNGNDLLGNLSKNGGRVARTRSYLENRVARFYARRVNHQCDDVGRSEEHTSELQSLMRISYAVFCLKKKNTRQDANVIGNAPYKHNVQLSPSHSFQITDCDVPIIDNIY